MSDSFCPHLGLRDDPATVMEFASSSNACNHAVPAAVVRLGHQVEFCLNANHTLCPVYQQAIAGPLPPSVALRKEPAISQRTRWIAGGALAALLVIAALLVVVLGGGSADGAVNAAAATSRPTRTPTEVLPTSGLLFNFSSTPEETVSSCRPPAGWVSYSAKPTDSLLRLSLVYNVSVEELQQANCLGASNIIRPGQVVYVPSVPTATPTLKPTLTPTRYIAPQYTATKKPSSGGNDRQPTSQPATRQPDPPTPIPPTNTPEPTATNPL